MKDQFLMQAKQEYSPRRRLVALIIAGTVFLGILPAALVYFSARLDQRWALPPLEFGVVNTIVGCGFIVAGLLLGWWANYIQFTVGRGTPIPVMATQQLLIQKPYSYCRNPMALGAIVAYLGVAILVGSVSAVLLVLAFAALLLVYIRLLEEKEMELRFGEAYREYRRQTPFIIPRFRKGNPATGSQQAEAVDKTLWLKVAAGWSFFMAICQTVISLSPAAAAYFRAPPPLLENRWLLFWMGEAAALVMVIFGCYALSGAGIIKRLPLLRLGLIGISSLYLLRGLFFILTALIILGLLEGEVLIQGEISTLVFLAAGIAYAIGTALNWRNLQVRR